MASSELPFSSDSSFPHGATIADLFSKASKTGMSDPFNDIFANVHSYFLPVPDFLNELRKLLEQGASTPNPLRDINYINLVKKWMKNNTHMLASEPAQVQLVRDFIGSLSEAATLKKFTGNLTLTLDISAKKPTTDDWFDRFFGESADGTETSGAISSESLLTLHSSEQLAQQLTLIDHQFLRRIPPGDLLHRAHAKAKVSVALHSFVRRCNETFAWAITEILKTIQLKARATMICKLIELSQQLRILKNFSGAIAVLSALKATPIGRLKSTWKHVPREARTLFEDLAALLNPDENHSAYRRLASAAQPPFIPYMGCLTKDISVIDEMPTIVHGDRVNWNKMSALGACLSTLRTVQDTVYLFQPNEALIASLAQIVRSNMNETEQYKLSHMLEPPTNAPSLSESRSDSASNLTPLLVSSSSDASLNPSSSSGTSGTGASSAVSSASLAASSTLSGSEGSESVIISHDDVNSATGSGSALLTELKDSLIPNCPNCQSLEDKYRAAKAEQRKTYSELTALASSELVTQQLTAALTEGTAGLEPTQMTTQTALRFMKKKVELRTKIKEQEDEINALQKHHTDAKTVQDRASTKLKEIYDTLGKSQDSVANMSEMDTAGVSASFEDNFSHILALLQSIESDLSMPPSE